MARKSEKMGEISSNERFLVVTEAVCEPNPARDDEKARLERTVKQLKKRIEQLEAENERLLRALRRESHHIDQRTGQSGYETVILKKRG